MLSSTFCYFYVIVMSSVVTKSHNVNKSDDEMKLTPFACDHLCNSLLLLSQNCVLQGIMGNNNIGLKIDARFQVSSERRLKGNLIL